jgi:hypothetical protein
MEYQYPTNYQDSKMTKMNEYNYDDYITGRKLIKPKRKEECLPSVTGSVIYNGCHLKKVHSAIINKKRTTYFKCRNMRTPYKVNGVCVFSGRIINFPQNMLMEIIHDHSPNCIYASGTNNSNSNSNSNSNINSNGLSNSKMNHKEKKKFRAKEKIKKRENKKENMDFQDHAYEPLSNNIKSEFTNEIIYDISDEAIKSAQDLPNLNIQLYANLDKSIEQKIKEYYEKMMNL